eukprot:145288-Rhodomonas_salina.1
MYTPRCSSSQSSELETVPGTMSKRCGSAQLHPSAGVTATETATPCTTRRLPGTRARVPVGTRGTRVGIPTGSLGPGQVLRSSCFGSESP